MDHNRRHNERILQRGNRGKQTFLMLCVIVIKLGETRPSLSTDKAVSTVLQLDGCPDENISSPESSPIVTF